MKRLISVFAFIPFMLGFNAALATPLTGGASFLDPGGTEISGEPIPITGDLDSSTNTLTIDPFMFFGNPWITNSVEFLSEGAHTRPDGSGGNISVVVAAGQVGAYVDMTWNANQVPTFMVWNVNSSPVGSSFTAVDSDGDGVPGQAFVAGPFPGFTVIYQFTVGEPPPGVDVSISINGGNIQECSEEGGSSIALTAVLDLTGGAEVGAIDWFVDGESVGSGETVTAFVSPAIHDVEVLASTTTGESDTSRATIEVRDTTAPVLDLAFVDRSGNAVTETAPGVRVSTRIEVTDICDPEPVAEGTAVPVFAVSNGDTIKISKNKFNTVKLPTSAIELSAVASDASGNKTTGMAVLSITD